MISRNGFDRDAVYLYLYFNVLRVYQLHYEAFHQRIDKDNMFHSNKKKTGSHETHLWRRIGFGRRHWGSQRCLKCHVFSLELKHPRCSKASGGHYISATEWKDRFHPWAPPRVLHTTFNVWEVPFYPSDVYKERRLWKSIPIPSPMPFCRRAYQYIDDLLHCFISWELLCGDSSHPTGAERLMGFRCFQLFISKIDHSIFCNGFMNWPPTASTGFRHNFWLMEFSAEYRLLEGHIWAFLRSWMMISIRFIYLSPHVCFSFVMY